MCDVYKKGRSEWVSNILRALDQRNCLLKITVSFEVRNED